MINEKEQLPDNNEQEEDANLSEGDLQMLDNAGGDPDDANVQRARLDDTDDEGEPLNEESSTSAASGSDLDVPGSELDDADEAIGEEDEENNNYSLGDN